MYSGRPAEIFYIYVLRNIQMVSDFPAHMNKSALLMQLNSDLIVNTICLQTKLVLMLALATYGTLAEFTIIYSYTVPQEFASDCTRHLCAAGFPSSVQN